MTRVTSKGQVTIPKEIRDRMGIGPGDEVGFQEEGGKMVLVNEELPTRETPGQRMVRLMNEFARSKKSSSAFDGMTTDEIIEFLRGPADDIEPR
jgi:AbrB family looped-hinge helix DNA binding protein